MKYKILKLFKSPSLYIILITMHFIIKKVYQKVHNDKTYIYYTFPSGASAGDCEYFQTKLSAILLAWSIRSRLAKISTKCNSTNVIPAVAASRNCSRRYLFSSSSICGSVARTLRAAFYRYQ